MRMPRIAVDAGAFNMPIKRLLPRIAETNANGVQLQVGRLLSFDDMSTTGRRQLLHELSLHNLGVAAIDPGLQRPLIDPAELDAGLDRIKRSMQLAFELKAQSVIVRSGGLPAADQPSYEILVAVLNDLARHGNRVGAIPTITVGGSSSERMQTLLAAVTEGPIGVSLDPALQIASAESPANSYRALVDSVNHITVRDAVQNADGLLSEVAVGRGEVPWEELLGLVREAEFGGWLVAVRTQGEDKPGDVTRAVQYLRTVLAE